MDTNISYIDHNNSDDKLPDFTEFETKYRVKGDALYEFKRLLEEDFDIKSFTYAQSFDAFYSKDGSPEEFIRHRYGDPMNPHRSEITIKVKPEGASNNVKRTEINIRIDGNDSSVVEAMASTFGFKYANTIYKYCHVYESDDAMLVFYTVRGKNDHFIEIEIKDCLLPTLTTVGAWEIIRKWEKRMSSLGVSPQKRLRKSLYEMYGS